MIVLLVGYLAAGSSLSLICFDLVFDQFEFERDRF